jgi:hypothetical protein
MITWTQPSGSYVWAAMVGSCEVGRVVRTRIGIPAWHVGFWLNPPKGILTQRVTTSFEDAKAKVETGFADWMTRAGLA